MQSSDADVDGAPLPGASAASGTMTRPAHMPIAAVVLIVAASACFTGIDVTVKHLSQRYPVPLLVWARWGVQALLMFALLAPTMRWNLVRTTRPGLHLVRGTVLIASSLCFFSAVKYLPLAEATALNYTSPILVTLLAGWLLRERITLPRWGFAAAGFVGMLLIVRPGTRMLDSASLFALAAAAAYASYQILTRKLAGEDLRVLLFYPSMCGAVLMSIVVSFYHDDAWYPTSDLALFLGIGVMGSFGHWLFTRAFRLASASAIAPFTYVQLVFSTIAAWLLFGTFPDRWALTGMIVIAGSGVVLTWYERWRASLAPAEPAAVD
ncbi:MAG TPA: DMT family transporter [Casimicrobiaceae bacterium]